MLRLVFLGVTVATFLVAAKAHGRQIRLERSLAGHLHVVFGGENPPFVVELWRTDRLFYWPTAALAALFVVALRFNFGRGGSAPRLFAAGVDVQLVLHVVVPLLVAFLVAGLASLVRSLRVDHPGAHVELVGALRAPSFAWWIAVVALFGLLAFVVRRLVGTP